MSEWHNSTPLDVELSIRSQHEQLSPIISECRDPVRVSIATQLNSTPLDVELSWVELHRYKWAFKGQLHQHYLNPHLVNIRLTLSGD